jgi:cell division septation protein DedD
MKAELDFKTEEITLDALLDKINEQRKINSELQTELRNLRSRENRLHKTSEAMKSENRRLQEDIAGLEQKIRELDIQLTLPESERTYAPMRMHEPIQKKSALQTFNWNYVIAPFVVISAIIGFKWFWSANTPATPAAAIINSVAAPTSSTPVPVQAIAPIAGATTPTAVTTAPTTQPAAIPTTNPVPPVEEGYLVVHNPLIGDDPVRVRNGFGSRAREVAFVDPGTKFKIREQSPNKMTRAILVEGKTLTVEDYFYKISDKEQWIFGFFTNKRTYMLPQ